MAIFLTILKIIGIVLLSIIGLVLLLLLLVLFVPVRYKLNANKEADNDIEVKVNLTWLLHLLNVSLVYSDDLYYRIRLGLIPIKKSDNLKKNKKVETNKEESATNNDLTNETPLENINPKENEEVLKEEEKEEEKDETVISSTDEGKDSIEDISEYKVYRNDKCITSDNKTLKNEESKIDGFDDCEDINDISKSDKGDNIFGAGKDKYIKIKNKINGIYDKLNNYYEIATDERNIDFVKESLVRIGKLLRHIKPKVLKGKIHYGTSDAYSLGKMLSIYSILFPLIYDKIQLVPDYENEVIEGNLVVKGRLVVAVVLYVAIKIYFNKDFKRLKRLIDNA